MLEHTRLNLINCVRESGMLGDQYRPVCPICGKESQNSISVFGTRTHENSIMCRDCGKMYDIKIEYTKDDNDKLTFMEGNTVKVENDYIIAVPDGYKASLESGGENDMWICIVPKTYDLSKNHISAEPYALGVGSINSFGNELMPNPQKYNADYKRVMLAIMLQNGMIDNSSGYAICDISDDCFAVYQGSYNEDDPRYLKARGFICAGSNIRMFHYFANYEVPLTDLDLELDYFESVLTEWLEKTIHVGEIRFEN